MNLYLIIQERNFGHGVYHTCLVAAESAEEAKEMSPMTSNNIEPDLLKLVTKMYWVDDTQHVSVKNIGIATADTKQRVILAAR